MVTPEEILGKRYEQGDIVFREGDSGDTMYVIMSGEVEISRVSEGRPIVIARMKRGDYFGEMSLIDGMPRSATVKAVTKTRLLPLSRRTLLQRAEEDPDLLVRMLGVLSTRIKEAAPLVKSMISGDVRLSRTWSECTEESPVSHAGDEPAGTGESSSHVPTRCDTSPETVGGSLLFPYDPNSCKWYEAGRVIFEEGDPGDEMFFIVEGKVEIRTSGETGKKRLALLGPQDFFGEMALITGQPRSADAIALTDTRVVPVCKAEFMAKLQSASQFSLFVLQVLISRLRAMLATQSH